jgi:hypothetical protein
MKFRREFGIAGWCWVSLACFELILCFTSRHPGSTWGLACGWTLMAILSALKHVFIYWELDNGCLRQHKFWKVTEIPLQRVTRVDCYTFGFASSSVKVTYSSASSAERDFILASPAVRGEFVDALRRFAPQAAFDL